MTHFLLYAAAAAAAAAVLLLLIRWRRKISKEKENREQIDRKLKEDALDRALSNGARRGGQPQAQAPVGIHYNSGAKGESGSMLRLTEQAESVSKEYLFPRSEVIYIGEEYGRAAVFQERGGGTLCCELFPYEDGVYVRLCGKGESRLIRKKQTAPLSEKAIRLRSGDRIETQAGIFLVELL